MSRFDSDLDYTDEPWNRPIRCANPDCDEQAEQEGWLCRNCEAVDHARAEVERQTRLRDDAFARGVRRRA